MRVTFVCPFDPRPADRQDRNGHMGGVERVYAQVPGLLARRGHEVTLVCSSDQDVGETKENGIRVRRVRRRLTLFRTPVARLAPQIPEDADVIQVVATYPFVTVPALQVALRRRLAAVLDFHFEPEPPGAVIRLAARVHARTVRRSFAQADAVIVRSLEYARRAASLANVSADRLQVVPNGVDPERFHPLPNQAGGAYILYVGRLVPYKGLDVLLKALGRLEGALPLKVVGVGPQEARLREQARRLGVAAQFLGRVPDEALPALYRAARFTVLPSVNRQEAFGMVLLESMACGTPVVASRLPGVSDVASQGGILAEPGDADSLAQALEYASQPGTLPRGERLAQPIRDRYSWAGIAERLERVYEQVTRRPRVAADTPGVRTDADPGRATLLRA